MADAALLTKQDEPSLLSRCTAFFVYMFEQLIPDPYVFAVILTFVAALLAYFLAPNAAPRNVLSAWYGGVFQILTFAFQMVLMLVTGYSLASAPVVASALAKVASIPQNAKSAISLTVFVAMVACWLNWGLGLVVSALLAREIAKRVRIDFGWLVAAAYTGFVISTEGLSGSIALSQATHGSALNIVEKVTGQTHTTIPDGLYPLQLDSNRDPFSFTPVRLSLPGTPCLQVRSSPILSVCEPRISCIRERRRLAASVQDSIMHGF